MKPTPPDSFWSRFDRWGLPVFVVLTLALVAFVGLKANVAQNRVNDCWWHIAAADEFVRTGVFAADPFLRDALPFPSFGLVEVINAGLAVLSGTDTRATWSWALACNALAAAWACYFCGCWASGSRWGGILAFAIWYAVAAELGLHGLAYPFLASLPLMQAYLLWFSRVPPATRWTLRRSALAGAALGLLFALHAWTGLFTGLCAGTIILADALALALPRWGELSERAAPESGSSATHPSETTPRFAPFIAGVLMLGAAGFAVASPWLGVQLAVRPVLAGMNSHNLFGYRITHAAIMFAIAVTLLLAAAAWLARPERARVSACPAVAHSRRRILARFALWSSIAVLLAWPPVNRAIAAATSDYMSNRVLLFVPIAIAVGVACRGLLAPGRAPRARRVAFALACLVLLAGPLRQRLAVEWYLLRTHDLDQHWLAHLDRLAPLKLSGKIILSDPDTSYFVRGRLGAYVLNLMPAMGSPAVDFVARHATVAESLRTGHPIGFTREADAVLVEKKTGLTEQFATASPAAIKAAWLATGWVVAYEDADLLLLARPAAAL